MSIIKTISNWLSGKKTIKRKIKTYKRDGRTVREHTRTMTVVDSEKKLSDEWRRELANNGDFYEKVGRKYRMITGGPDGIHDDPKISDREIERRLSNAFNGKKARRYL